MPLIKHPPAAPFVYVIVLGEGIAPQATVMLPGAVIVGNAAGSTVIVLDTEASGRPQRSVAVHISVRTPPHAGAEPLMVEAFEVPLNKHPPANPFV